MAGKAWSRESSASSEDRSWGSQCRDLGVATRILGMAADLPTDVRPRIPSALGVDTLLLLEGAKAKGYRAIGKVACGVLRAIRGVAGKAMKLLIERCRRRRHVRWRPQVAPVATDRNVADWLGE